MGAEEIIVRLERGFELIDSSNTKRVGAYDGEQKAIIKKWEVVHGCECQ
jgi:hypothetical protein